MKKFSLAFIVCSVLTIITILAIVYYQLKSADDEFKEIMSQLHDYNKEEPTIQTIVIENARTDESKVNMLYPVMEEWTEKYEDIISEKDKRLQHLTSSYYKKKERVTEYTCTGTDLQNNKLLNKHYILVRIASKLFRNFTICMIDQLIDMIGDKKYDDSIFILFYDQNILYILRIGVNHKNKTVNICEKKKISVGNEETCVVFFGLKHIIKQSGM